MAFELWPAIDLIDGAAVRLVRGKIEKKTVYTRDLRELVQRLSVFASGIHVVDLDGAFAGSVQQSPSIKEIVEAATVPVEVGGGIRSIDEIKKLLDLGVSRVILGTSVVTHKHFLQQAINEFHANHIVIGADLIKGRLATHGWERSSEVSIAEFFDFLEATGKVKTAIITDISRDGTLKGPSFKLYKQLAEAHPDFSIIASGGVGNIEDIKLLRDIGVTGVVFGKAFLDGMITDEELMQFTQEQC